MRILGFRIVAEHASEWTSFEEDRGSNPRAILQREFLDVHYQGYHDPALLSDHPSSVEKSAGDIHSSHQVPGHKAELVQIVEVSSCFDLVFENGIQDVVPSGE